ncbi:Transposase [Corynebacterium timonense]|uniref:Transposase n=1 Tax=Corynebacterium timonense TaxID=441500 RepID=A0A1H1P0J7_9CORY|nr:Transposase [Corynebacterium timonense]
MTPAGRQKIVDVVLVDGYSQHRVAERLQISTAPINRWVKRARNGEALTDRSSQPRSCPHQLPVRTQRRIITLRLTRQWGPHRIGYHLGIPRSTVGRVLARYNLPKLACIDQATGLPVRKAPPVRYERSQPGDMIHVDIKKLSRIPNGGGWRVHGRGSEQDRRAGRARNAQRQAGAPAALGTIKHVYTKPYRPQTNGNVERFNRTLMQEWAYIRLYASEKARQQTYAEFIHDYNYHRAHTAIGGLTPAQRVHNITGKYS